MLLSPPYSPPMRLTSFEGGHGALSSYRPPRMPDYFDPTPSRTQKLRPKLSLNTVDVPSNFSFKSTSLRLDTLSVISPTSRNTFHNVYTTNPEQSTPSDSPTSSSPSPQSQGHRAALDYRDSVSSSAEDKLLSSSPATSVDITTGSVSAGAESSFKTQLLNVDLTSDPRRASTQSAPHLRSIISSSRDRSPSQRSKSVSFKPHLTETIHTNTYILAHSDLLALPESEIQAQGARSSSLPLPHRARSRSNPEIRPLSRNEIRWRTAIESAKAEAELAVQREAEVADDDEQTSNTVDLDEECINESGKRHSPTPTAHDTTDSADCISVSESKRRKPECPLLKQGETED